MVLGSDVVLEKDILRKPKPFVTQSTTDVLSLDKLEIFGDATVDNAAGLVFTVPAGFEVFITDFFLSGQNATLGNDAAFLDIGNGNSAFKFNMELGTLQSSHISHSFITPMRLQAGQTITINSNTADMFVSASIRGFQIEKKIN